MWRVDTGDSESGDGEGEGESRVAQCFEVAASLELMAVMRMRLKERKS